MYVANFTIIIILIIIIIILIDMLDPRNDLKLQIVDNAKKVIQDFSKVTNKWSGLTGTNQIIR